MVLLPLLGSPKPTVSSRVTRGGGSEQAPPSLVAPAPGGTSWGSPWILGCPGEVGGLRCLLMWRGVQSRVQGDLGQEPLSPFAWATPSHFRARPLGASAFIYSQCCHPTLGSHRETPKNKAWSGSCPALSLRATLPRPQEVLSLLDVWPQAPSALGSQRLAKAPGLGSRICPPAV